MMKILLVLFTFSFTQLAFSQEITTGIGLFMNGTNCKSDLTNNIQTGFLTGNSRPKIGRN